MDDEIRIRDTQIKVWTVYRDLVFHGGPEADVLQKYPELSPGDLVAVREHTAASIAARTHDEITGRPILPRDRLVHGRYYKGRCRNATIARWNADENCFFHWREKFDNIFVERIKYPTDETEPWWDVYDPVEELADCRFEIPFDGQAVFNGNPDHLVEFNVEMWRKVQRHSGR